MKRKITPMAVRMAWLAAAILPVAPVDAAARSRPNIVVIVTDDLNDWVGFMGGQAITPNLDKAAASGMVFTAMQAAATFCTPSRSALMTGIAPGRSGNYRNQPAQATTPRLHSFVDLLSRGGYETFGTGKVFHHSAGYLDRRGFDEWFLWNPVNKTRGWALAPWGQGAPTPKRPASAIPGYTGWSEFDYAALPNEDEPRMADTIAADWASEVVSRKHARPFLLTFGTYAPHKPNFVPRRYFDLYQDRVIAPPVTPAGDLDDLPGDPHQKPLCCVSPVKPTIGSGAWPAHREILRHGDWTNAIRGYLAAASYADAQIGKLLAALSQGPNAQNTVIVFLSDNGYHLGEKDKWAKHSLWQRTTNVPFFIAGAGVIPGRFEGPTSLLDVMPTILRLAGVRARQKLDGRDLGPILAGHRPKPGRLVVTAGNRGEWAVTDGRYRLIRYAGGGEELYDLARDPHEWNNLAKVAATRTTKLRLDRAIPRQVAAEGPSPEMGQLRLVTQGEQFHWVRDERPVDAEAGE